MTEKIQKTHTPHSSNGGAKNNSLVNGSHLSTDLKLPEFFLYTKLGQNETKSLKKAPTNKAERKVLAQIFNLKSLLDSNEPPNKIELLKLDFHYMNYIFCKEN